MAGFSQGSGAMRTVLVPVCCKLFRRAWYSTLLQLLCFTTVLAA
jgi:hypothetical protein